MIQINKITIDSTILLNEITARFDPCNSDIGTSLEKEIELPTYKFMRKPFNIMVQIKFNHDVRDTSDLSYENGTGYHGIDEIQIEDCEVLAFYEDTQIDEVVCTNLLELLKKEYDK